MGERDQNPLSHRVAVRPPLTLSKWEVVSTQKVEGEFAVKELRPVVHADVPRIIQVRQGVGLVDTLRTLHSFDRAGFRLHTGV